MRKLDKKEQIIYATFKLFARKGYHTSMADIAKEVDIKVPSIYSHFDSKDEIIYLVMTREIKGYFENLHKEICLLDKEECEIKLKKICFSIIGYFREPERIRFWKNISLIHNEELRIKCRNLVREQEIDLAESIGKIFEEASKNGQIRTKMLEGSLYLYMAMIQGILDGMLMYYDTTLDMDEFVKKIWEAYWEGIKA